MNVSNLYHTYPLVCMDSITEFKHAFIEAHTCIDNESYLDSVYRNDLSYVLDCGVGMSPDLNNPMQHVEGDPSFGVKYLNLMLNIEPDIMVIPDVLGNAKATNDNLYNYIDIISLLAKGFKVPEFMYVIQGQTKEEAHFQVKVAIKNLSIKWVGFPRIVHYYGSTTSASLSNERIEFVKPLLDLILNRGKKIHLLGVNSIEELIWAAQSGLSTDTRLATLAAVHNFDITQSRPFNVKVNLCENYTDEVKNKIVDNVRALNQIYYSNVKKD